MIIYWCSRLLQDVPVSGDWLHPSEKLVADGFKFPKKRNDWLLGRWTAKNAVKSFLQKSFPHLDYSQIEIRAAEDGAPEVFFENKRLPVFISLSHSQGIGFCTITQPGFALGCDLEKIEPRSEYFVNDYFTKNEQALCSKSNYPELIANLIWSAKESTLKAIRTGLRVDPRLMEVSFEKEGRTDHWQPLKVLAKNSGQTFFGHWRVVNDIVYTVVANEPQYKLEQFKNPLTS
ncbi:MAG: hypothetical protein DWQ02_23090 [Bacteroidetes bacterium]|nr:MAG: hypothetical protein DWQ02_23090 [Bacteroidota bacterium]